MKRCTKCGESKTFDAFSKDRSRADGYASRCRACRSSDKKIDYDLNKAKYATRSKRWRDSNRDYKNEYDRRFYQTHKTQHAAARAAWTERNYQKKLADDRAYYAAHKEVWRQRDSELRYGAKRAEFLAVHRAYNKKYRATERGRAAHCDIQRRRKVRLIGSQSESLSYERILARFSVFGCRCVYCGNHADTRDHIKAIANGGPHLLANLVPACRSCNASKGAKRLRVPLHVGVLSLP